jgi:phosphoenolpyruvate phosphomutase
MGNQQKEIELSALDSRVCSLRELLTRKKCLRVIEAHSPLVALMIEGLCATGAEGSVQYDALWSSSLTDSTLRAKPDIEILDVASRIQNIGEIFDVSSKPLIFDGDTGGKVEHFVRNVRMLERTGVSAVIVEDKMGLKRNSLLGTDVPQAQESVDEFCEKITCGKRAQLTAQFMLFARVESLILNLGMREAIYRAERYLQAGADGIMIHSRRSDCGEIEEFARLFRQRHHNAILICSPSNFNRVYFKDLSNIGFNIVIYANQLLRASYLAMRQVAAAMLLNGRSSECEPQCLPISEIVSLIPVRR